MKTKLLFTLLTTIFSVSANAATPVVGGTVTFIGQIVNSTCSVNNVSSNMVVNLGQYELNRLNKTGDKSISIPFEIKLDNCERDASEAISVAFYGENNATQPSLLRTNTDGRANSAQNIGIEILDHASKTLRPDGKTLSSPRTSNSDSMTLNFSARYVATGKVTTGDVNAIAIFQLKYH